MPVSEMNEILTAYLSLPVERPSLLHSQILMIAENYLSYKEHEQFDFCNSLKSGILIICEVRILRQRLKKLMAEMLLFGLWPRKRCRYAFQMLNALKIVLI